MNSFRRILALSLLVAVTSSSVEVLFGDRHAIDQLAATQVVEVPHGLIGAALQASHSDSDRPAEDCPCLCACACAGAQLVMFSLGDAFRPPAPALGVPLAEPTRSFPLHALRPPFRPPLV